MKILVFSRKNLGVLEHNDLDRPRSRSKVKVVT